jgi:DNA repair exonuclease SbcCD ATPase subunit
MIVLKKMTWSNVFSYGENNSIEFDKSPLTQIVGLNGHGKSSIALILEEVLFNKNSKNIKKGDILNRHSKAKSYKISLEFEKDVDLYLVETVRGSTQSVVLLKNSEDISAHTATNTFKLLESILGFDHKTFAQIVYQSSAASLEFLTSTDTNRKKFLIDLLKLNRYVELGEVFKTETKALEKEIAVLDGKANTLFSWISKHSKEELHEKPLQEVPQYPVHLEEEITTLFEKVSGLDTINKKIVQNNKYKEILDSIKVEVPGPKPTIDLEALSGERAILEKEQKDSQNFVLKMNALGGRDLGALCPTCLQDIDYVKTSYFLDEHREKVSSAVARLKEIKKVFDDYNKDLEAWNRKEKTKKEYEQYYNLYDSTLEKQVIDYQDLKKIIESKKIILKESFDNIKKIQEENTKKTAYNARIEVIKETLKEYSQEVEEVLQEKTLLEEKHNKLNILTKTFSSTGLVAYKIECLVKDLEKTINTYLTQLSDGRFQLEFQLSQGDKLNVVVWDQNHSVEIFALSSGEKARVNAAALLGIRKLMQGLSNTRINLLVLDETIENLDLEGKEKLVEVLLEEPYLNTFVISHGFSHPLLEKINVIKKNNISRIEYG